MGQLEPGPSAAAIEPQSDGNAPSDAPSDAPPVAALAYAPAPAEVTRRVVRLLAGFTILYAAATLLSRAISLLSTIHLSNASVDWTRLFSPQGLIYMGASVVEAAVLVGMIVAAARLRQGRDTRRWLVLACWGYLAGTAAVLTVQTTVTLLRPWDGGLDYRLYWAGQGAVSLLGRAVFPLTIAGVFGGKRGEALVREGR